jgi:hypothetical protein
MIGPRRDPRHRFLPNVFHRFVGMATRTGFVDQPLHRGDLG